LARVARAQGADFSGIHRKVVIDGRRILPGGTMAGVFALRAAILAAGKGKGFASLLLHSTLNGDEPRPSRSVTRSPTPPRPDRD